YLHHCILHYCPTRRSSDLFPVIETDCRDGIGPYSWEFLAEFAVGAQQPGAFACFHGVPIIWADKWVEAQPFAWFTAFGKCWYVFGVEFGHPIGAHGAKGQRGGGKQP